MKKTNTKEADGRKRIDRERGRESETDADKVSYNRIGLDAQNTSFQLLIRFMLSRIKEAQPFLTVGRNAAPAAAYQFVSFDTSLCAVLH